jgi:hypothetical protein
VPLCLLCAPAAIIIGMVKNALLPIWDEDRVALRKYCTTQGCGLGLTHQKNVKQKDGTVQVVTELKHELMKRAEFNKKPASFFHKYCRHYTPPKDEQEKRLRQIADTFAATSDPTSPGQLLFRVGGPVLKGLEQLIVLVQAGKLQGGH